jgi:copper chaperone
MATTTLKVPDISCEHCERTITETLSPLAGVRDVRVDVPAKLVHVNYDESAVDVERMKALLAEEEYPVESIQS